MPSQEFHKYCKDMSSVTEKMDIKCTNDHLFFSGKGGIGNFEFEQSMRQFYTTANTKVCNDQTAFAKYCYGDMPSCKEGDGLNCTKNNSRWINY